MTAKERFEGITEWFSRNMEHAESELKFSNPYELLVAVILSAQCTDKRVNMVTPAFFERFPDVDSLAAADKSEVLECISSISYPNSKAEHLIGAARGMKEHFGSAVPDTREELESLPGVGRKTAGVILSVAFGKQEIPVDTHVFRVSGRIGLVRNPKSPLDTEMALRKGFPSDKLAVAHHWLILHGRYVCTAKNPKCSVCGIKKWCLQFSKNINFAKDKQHKNNERNC